MLFEVQMFRQYLEHQEFLLETENQALSWHLSRPCQFGKLGNWIAKLTSLKFKVAYIRPTQKSSQTFVFCEHNIRRKISWMLEPDNFTLGCLKFLVQAYSQNISKGWSHLKTHRWSWKWQRFKTVLFK